MCRVLGSVCSFEFDYKERSNGWTAIVYSYILANMLCTIIATIAYISVSIAIFLPFSIFLLAKLEFPPHYWAVSRGGKMKAFFKEINKPSDLKSTYVRTKKLFLFHKPPYYEPHTIAIFN